MRAVGYTEVFVMHKEDLQSILNTDSSLRNNLANRASKLLGDINAGATSPKLARKSFATVAQEFSAMSKTDAANTADIVHEHSA